MPWWIWLILVLFFLIMLCAGLLYVAWRFNEDFTVVAETADKLSAIYEAAENEEPEPRDDRPFFTRPVVDAARRYEAVYQRVLIKEERKNERRQATWKRWGEKSLREEDLNAEKLANSNKSSD